MDQNRDYWIRNAIVTAKFLLLSQIHAIYRSGSETNRITMDKARQEFQSGFFGNQIVRDAAAGAARATVQSQFNQNRYWNSIPNTKQANKHYRKPYKLLLLLLLYLRSITHFRVYRLFIFKTYYILTCSYDPERLLTRFPTAVLTTWTLLPVNSSFVQ